MCFRQELSRELQHRHLRCRCIRCREVKDAQFDLGYGPVSDLIFIVFININRIGSYSARIGLIEALL